MRPLSQYTLPLAVIGLAVMGPATTQQARVAIRVNQTITSASEAISLAHEWTGFDSLYLNSVALESACSEETMQFVDTTTPFLHRQLNGRRSWKVTYHELPPFVDSPKRGNATCDCEVWLDSLTGQLLLAKIVSPHLPAVGYRMPTPSESEEFRHESMSSYLGLPGVAPNLDMLSALRIWGKQGLSVRDVWIQYVVFAMEWPDISPLVAQGLLPPGMKRGSGWEDLTPKPAWVIYLREPPQANRSAAAPSPVRTASEWRMVIDAMTGIGLDGLRKTTYPLLDDTVVGGNRK